MAEINGEEKRIGVSGEQIEEAVGKVPTIEADVKANKQNISALQADVSKHTEDIAKNTADIEKKANADEVYSKEETDNAITAKVAEIVSGAPKEFDTLKEMSDWLTEHSDSAATMNSAIQENTTAIADNATAIEGNTADIEQNKSDILLLDKNKMGYDYGYAYAQNASSTGWFKLASFKCEDTSANIAIATFYITGINCEQNGLLTVSVMANTGVGNGISSLGCSWAYVGRNYNGIVTIKPNDFKVVANVNGGYIDVELWCAVTTAYSGFKARLMNFEGRVVFHEKNIVTLYKSNTGEIKSTELNNPDNASLSRERASINGLSVLLNDFETRLKALETAQTATISE